MVMIQLDLMLDHWYCCWWWYWCWSLVLMIDPIIISFYDMPPWTKDDCENVFTEVTTKHAQIYLELICLCDIIFISTYTACCCAKLFTNWIGCCCAKDCDCNRNPQVLQMAKKMPQKTRHFYCHYAEHCGIPVYSTQLWQYHTQKIKNTISWKLLTQNILYCIIIVECMVCQYLLSPSNAWMFVSYKTSAEWPNVWPTPSPDRFMDEN